MHPERQAVSHTNNKNLSMFTRQKGKEFQEYLEFLERVVFFGWQVSIELL
jgi:hypothetical protein